MSMVVVISNTLQRAERSPKGPITCGVECLQTNWDAIGSQLMKSLFLRIMIKLLFLRPSPLAPN